MSYKTDRLTDLFPDAFAVEDRSSLLFRLLDAIGAEHMGADEAVKQLLKSHWVNYAEGAALDGLAATFNVTRRRLRSGELENDEGFRQRLKAVVPLFTGGGTRRAVIGAVRSALGLPFNLEQLNLSPRFDGLHRDLEQLITLEEFSPRGEQILGRDVADIMVDGIPVSTVDIDIDMPAVREERPAIRWNFTQGAARELVVIVTPDLPGAELRGIRSTEAIVIPQGSTLVFTALENGRLSATTGLTELAAGFTNLDGSTPALLPEVPVGRSRWRFQARSALFDISLFDEVNTYDLPTHQVEMNWLRYEPLTFDVHVPYFLKDAAAELVAFHGYPGSLFVFEGLPIETLVDVVDQTRAAGVRGSVQFSLNFLDVHEQREQLRMAGQHSIAETLDVSETLTAASMNDFQERHEIAETFVIGGVWDVSPFDQGHGFEE